MEIRRIWVGDTEIPILAQDDGNWMVLVNLRFCDFDVIQRLLAVSDSIEAFLLISKELSEAKAAQERDINDLRRIKELSIKADQAFNLLGRHIPEYGFAISCNLELRKRIKPEIPKPKLGAVYLLRAENGYYKIGQSSQPHKRIASIKGSMPLGMSLVHLVETKRYTELEKELHKRFAEKRVNGEWFALEPKDIAYIKGLHE